MKIIDQLRSRLFASSPPSLRDDAPTATYRELADTLVPVGSDFLFIPSLASLLFAAESKKSTPLTEQEVLSIRDRAPVTIVSISAIEHVSQRRGYADLHPANCWSGWLELRKPSENEPAEQFVDDNPS